MKKGKIKCLALSLILSLVFALTLSSGCGLLPDIEIIPAPQPSPPPPPGATTPINPEWSPDINQDNAFILPNIAEVVAKVKPSVVAINVEVVTYDIFNRPLTQEGAGSGWVIDGSGLIVTNNHVVQGAQTITITFANGEIFTAEVIRTDPLTDLAVVRIDAQNLPALNIGDSSQLRVGDWVIAIGNPLGLGISAKEGIISRKEVSIMVSSGQRLYDLIETSAAINPGNSGGPLVNMAGEVIGITSAKLSAIGIEGLGYAISSNTALPIVEELIQKGYVVRPWLGVGLQSINEWIAIRYGLAVEQGALITQVASGSPADKAGLEQGDVVANIDDIEITDAQDLIRAIHSNPIGQKVNLTFWRGETQMTTEAILVESPPP